MTCRWHVRAAAERSSPLRDEYNLPSGKYNSATPNITPPQEEYNFTLTLQDHRSRLRRESRRERSERYLPSRIPHQSSPDRIPALPASPVGKPKRNRSPSAVYVSFGW